MHDCIMMGLALFCLFCQFHWLLAFVIKLPPPPPLESRAVIDHKSQTTMHYHKIYLFTFLLLCWVLINCPSWLYVQTTQLLTDLRVPYSGKLSREKTFANFTVLWQFAKVFSAKFGAWHPLARQSEQSVKIFPVKIVFSPIHESFLPWKLTTIRYVHST